MKKSIIVILAILLVSCATPQANANTRVPPTRIATPVLFPSAETLSITPLSASAPSVQFTEIKWTAFSSRSNKLAIFARQPDQDHGGSLCVYQIGNEQTFALEQLWGTTTDHEVDSLALSPDGKLLVVVLDGIFIVWIDASNGNFLHIFRGNQAHFNPNVIPSGYYPLGRVNVVFSPDGKWLAVLNGNRDSSVTLWNAKTAEIGQIVSLDKSYDTVSHISFTADSKQLVAILLDGETFTNQTVYAWNLLEQTSLRVGNLPPRGEGGSSYSVISPDGKLAAFGIVSDDKVHVWDLMQGRELFTLSVGTVTEYYWYERYFVFSPDSKVLFTTGADALIAWDLATGTQVASYPGGYGSDFSLSPDGQSLLISDRTTLSLWETDSRKMLASIPIPKSGKVTTFTFQSIPSFGDFNDLYNFSLTLPPVQIDSFKMIDATTGWGNATNGRLYHTTDGGRTWQDVNPDGNWYTWSDFFALDADHAWAVTNDFATTIWHTGDGGQTWEMPRESTVDAHLYTYTISLQFMDAQTGWYLGAEEGNHGGSRAYLGITRDGGQTWEGVGSSVAFWRYSGIFFYDRQTAFMYGTNGPATSDYGSPLARDFIDGKLTPYLEKTTNGGQTWSTIPLPRLSPIPEEIRALYSSDVRMECGVPGVEFESTFSRRILAHVVCKIEYHGDLDFVYFSDDGGRTWQAQPYVPKDNPIHDFITPLIGWQQIKASDGQSYSLQQTLDGGQTWNAIGDVDWEAYELDFVDERTGWALTYHGDFTVLLHTTDGGRNWKEVRMELTPVSSRATLTPTPTSTAADGLSWRPINNGLTDASVYALVIDPSAPTTLYAATWNTGMFKSTDGGGNWSAINTGLPHTPVEALALDSVTPTNLYAGTWCAGISESGGGIFKSMDAGANWQTANTGVADCEVQVLVIDPTWPTILYAGTRNGYIYKSSHSGADWWEIKTGTGAGINDLVIDPRMPSNVYAGADDGVYKSTNGGASWVPVNNYLPDTSVSALAIDPVTPTTIYAGTWSGGVFKSTDSGATWSAVNNGLTDMGILVLVIDPATPTTIYAGTNGGIVFKSMDGGASWNPLGVGLPNTSVLALAIDPANPTTLYAGTSGGIFVVKQLK